MTILKQLCQKFVERSNELGYKGKRRDAALLDSMIGSIHALMLAGQTNDADHVLRATVLLFSTRGYSECVRIANKPDEPVSADAGKEA